MALEKEIWQQDIVKGLYKENEFLNYATNEDQYVLAGKVVHIPQAGTASGVVKNRTTLPATVNKRSDTEVTYVLDEYTSNPTLIPNLDTIQLSYDKRASVMEENMNYLREAVAEWMLRVWAPSVAAQYIRTTGTATLGKAPGATGDRKGFRKEDLKRARTILNNQNVPKQGRVALIPGDMMEYLLDDEDLKKRDSSLELDMKAGVVSRLYGFDLMERPTTVSYTAATTPVPKDPDAATAATDNASVMCWHPSAVARAMGTIDMFENIGDPTYFGDIYSFLVMMGGRQRRADGKGIVSIIEAAA
ncbi:hypothetical protein DYU11_18460 [Fibrisoma montanum]|uniref:P22 coat protein-protein 5 domain protein n=1 Tax=Fibrisoma montanum TaxID=2305895 RepID=A0A418M613_9BACT|nr:phage capsid protein [Fibrisoma montanum]RIV21389.1 hypothetical protein DYU11_18460 [Fibrisoma montanum]